MFNYLLLFYYIELILCFMLWHVSLNQEPFHRKPPAYIHPIAASKTHLETSTLTYDVYSERIVELVQKCVEIDFLAIDHLHVHLPQKRLLLYSSLHHMFT